jgi:predicted DNA-binding transcriptional regulator AlpA
MFENKIFVDAGEVARAFGWSREWFRRRLKELIDLHAFPSPLPSGRWHVPAVEHWIANYGDAATAARQAQVGTVHTARDRAALERIFRRVA